MPVLVGYVIGKLAAQWVLICNRALAAVLGEKGVASTRAKGLRPRLAKPTGGALSVFGLALVRVVSSVGLALAAAFAAFAGLLWVIVPGPPFAHAFVAALVFGLTCYGIRCASLNLGSRGWGRP